MLSLLAPPETFAERKGPDFFEPAHPVPPARRANVLSLILGARRNLLGVWTKGDYKPTTGAIRVLRRQVVLVNAPDDIKHVMATNNDIYERKSPQMRRALEYLLGDGLFISDGETWRRRRPLVVEAVHKNRLPVFGQVMQDAAVRMGERWRSLPSGESLDMLPEMAELTAQIIARTVFGNEIGSAAAREVIEGFTSYQHAIDSTNLGYFFGADEGLPVRRSRRLAAAVGRVHKVIDEVVEAHIAGRGDGDTVLEGLVRSRRGKADPDLTVAALRNEAATIFMAGHETTAATLTWAWYCLANAPWAEAAVHAEIDAVCGGRTPSIEDLPRLKYCTAVIEETLRLYPPVPILSRQCGSADRVGSIDVEPGSLVLVVPWLLQRSPALWPEPDLFRPERFLERRPAPYTYAPFAVGPRICAGLAFGLAEAVLCLAVLAQRARVRVVEGTAVEPVCRLTLRPRNGLPVKILPR